MRICTLVSLFFQLKVGGASLIVRHDSATGNISNPQLSNIFFERCPCAGREFSVPKDIDLHG